MSVLKVGFEVYARMLPLLSLAVGILFAFALFLDHKINALVFVFLHTLALYYAHVTILTGQKTSRGKFSGFPVPSIGFLGLVFLLLSSVAAATFFGFSGIAEPGFPTSLVIGAGFGFTTLFLSLILFGVTLPRSVQRRIKGASQGSGKAVAKQTVFISAWLVVLTIPFVIVLVPLISVLNDMPLQSPLRSVFSALSCLLGFVPTALTASVLSHAYLRANNLPPCGLIKTL